MSSVRAVCEYSNLSFWECLELPLDMFLLMRKNYVLDKLSKTEEGRQYLEDCERYKKTDIDAEGLKRLFGGDENA